MTHTVYPDLDNPNWEEVEEQFSKLDTLERCEVKAICAISISFKSAQSGEISPEAAGELLYMAMNYYRLAVITDLVSWIMKRPDAQGPEALRGMFNAAVESFDKVSAELADKIDQTPGIVEMKKSMSNAH